MSQSFRPENGPARRHRPTGAAASIVLALAVQALTVTGSAIAAAPPDPGAPSGGVQPTIHYEEVVAHENDRITFAPGGRVTIGFTPRPDDRWKLGGGAPRALPAGRLDGDAMRRQGPKSVAPIETPAAVPNPEPPLVPDPDPLPLPVASGVPDGSAVPEPGPLDGVDAPIVDPALIVDVEPASWTGDAAGTFELDATVSPDGLRREVFGFLPYWELNSSSTTLDYSKLSTIAFFGVGADAYGNLQKKNSDGTTTVGWSGWTSSKMTSIINAAHQKHTRVVLTVQSFAWTTAQLDRQKKLLGSSTARLRLAQQIAAAVRDRGADGVNLDFEPLASTYEEEFTALVRTIRSELNKVASGYQLTFDTTGYIGNYPIEAATAPGGADAIFIMGYDYRGSSSTPVGSIAPMGRDGYDIRETVAAYAARVSPSKLILGVPYYGRAWSTDTDQFNAKNISGTKYGASSTVVYDNAIGVLSQHGRRYDATERVAWTAYRRENCTTTYGCVNPWRQLYVDDATALRAKYDLINAYDLRGAGIWALGYDGTRTELWKAIEDKFMPDRTPPVVGVSKLATTHPNPAITVHWGGTDFSGVASYDVQVSTNGGGWATWLSGTTAASATYRALDGRGYAFRVRARDVKGNLSAWNVTSTWTASPKLAVGGFGRVTIDGLSMRTVGSTTAAKVGTLNAGDVVAITAGPTTAGGYTWYRVTGPLAQWGVVSGASKNVWVATRSATENWVVAAPAPNSTTVKAVIGKLGVRTTGTTWTGAPGRAFSPNGDGVRDTVQLTWTNAVALDSLELRVFRANGTQAGSIALAQRGAGAQAYAWDARLDGVRVPDGTYLVTLVGRVGATTYYNPSASFVSSLVASFGVTVDTAGPALTAAASPAAFSPNGDGLSDTTSLAWSSNQPVTGTLRILRGTTVVRSWSLPAASSGAIAWNGRTSGGTLVADGTYTLRLAGRDAAGNLRTRDATVTVDRTLRNIVRSPVRFYPQDGDSLARTSRLSFALARAAKVTVAVYRGSTLVRTAYSGRALAAGSHAWTWDGRDAAGRYVTPGTYALRVTAVSWVGTTGVARSVVADAFQASLSATTIKADQALTVTFTTSEPLRAAPRVTLTQQGLTAVTRTSTLIGSNRYQVKFRIAAGAPGRATIRIAATDRLGGWNRTYVALTVR